MASRSHHHVYCAAAVIAVAVCAGTATPARASCGDWLADHDHAATAQKQKGELPASNGPSTEPARDGSKPCRGLSCGKRPEIPLEVPPLTFTSSEQDRCVVSTPSVTASREATLLGAPADDAWPPPVHRSRLEHPPRAS